MGSEMCIRDRLYRQYATVVEEDVVERTKSYERSELAKTIAKTILVKTFVYAGSIRHHQLYPDKHEVIISSFEPSMARALNLQPKDYLDGTGTKRDDVGFYVSADQVVWRENGEDEQGLGLFGRFGSADDRVNEIEIAWSCGASYRGLLEGRDDDVIGLGITQARFSEDAGFSASSERVVELFYNAQLTPWLHVTPDVQWVANPGGDRSVSNAWVAGLRVQMEF